MATDPTKETTKMRLDNDITVNGIVYKAGRQVEVPKDQAEDLERLDYDHNKYKEGLQVQKKYRPAHLQNINVGSNQ